MKTALVLSTAFITTTPLFSNKEERIEQYLYGIQQISEYVREHSNDFDVFFVDNTVEDEQALDSRLKDAIAQIPNLKQTCFFFDNELGKKNKGAGLIIQWKKLLPQIPAEYEYVIHFEPRQKLENFSFFERYLAKPDTYLRTEIVSIKRFKLFPMKWKQVMTGLLSGKRNELQAYADQVSLPYMVSHNVSIEKDLYTYVEKNHISFVPIDSMGVLWHDGATNTYIRL